MSLVRLTVAIAAIVLTSAASAATLAPVQNDATPPRIAPTGSTGLGDEGLRSSVGNLLIDDTQPDIDQRTSLADSGGQDPDRDAGALPQGLFGQTGEVLLFPWGPRQVQD